MGGVCASRPPKDKQRFETSLTVEGNDDRQMLNPNHDVSKQVVGVLFIAFSHLNAVRCGCTSHSFVFDIRTLDKIPHLCMWHVGNVCR